jgi:hypothetical protein
MCIVRPMLFALCRLMANSADILGRRISFCRVFLSMTIYQSARCLDSPRAGATEGSAATWKRHALRNGAARVEARA